MMSIRLKDFLKIARNLLLLLPLTLIVNCQNNNALHKKLSKDDPKNFIYQGHYKISKAQPSKFGDTISDYSEVGIASWYGSNNGFHGKVTANGDTYNKHTLSAAHRTLPLPSLVRVTNIKNNKSVIVMVNDRGPYKKGRLIDVSEKAAVTLGFKTAGTTKVKVKYLAKETDEFLKKIALRPKHGAKVGKKRQRGEHCSINCYVQLVNMKHKVALSR